MHGFVENKMFKHNDIINYEKNYSIYKNVKTQDKTQQYFKNYKFIWEIYNEVASQNGIILPKSWSCYELYTKKLRNKRNRSDAFILEPMGPTILVDRKYSSDITFGFEAESKTNTLYKMNWYKLAEYFFMVKQPVLSAISNKPGQFSFGIICESWRALSYKELSRERLATI
jgi:hypothetical protein